MESLDPRTTALVLIDLQNGVASMSLAPHAAADVIRTAMDLGARFRAAAAPVVLVNVAYASDFGDTLRQPVDQPRPMSTLPAGWTDLVDGLARPTDIRITKHQWGAFHGTDLDDQLRRRGIKTIVLGGIATNFGVESTARQGWERSYAIVAVEDAITATTARCTRSPSRRSSRESRECEPPRTSRSARFPIMRIAVAGATGTVGRYVVERAQQAGHDIVMLSRSRGVDVRIGDGLANALSGVETIIDVMNPDTIEESAATAFFTETAQTLQRVGAERGTRHIVTLSIVGIQHTNFGYYGAKLAQERAATAGPVPSTILRATQFHELPAQLIALTRKGSEARVLDLHSQPIAARSVAGVLVQLAEGAPEGRARDLAGPEEADLVALGRRFVEYRKIPITVLPQPTNVPRRALIPDDGARIEGPTFEDWLASADAAAMSI